MTTALRAFVIASLLALPLATPAGAAWLGLARTGLIDEARSTISAPDRSSGQVCEAGLWI